MFPLLFTKFRDFPTTSYFLFSSRLIGHSLNEYFAVLWIIYPKSFISFSILSGSNFLVKFIVIFLELIFFIFFFILFIFLILCSIFMHSLINGIELSSFHSLLINFPCFNNLFTLLGKLLEIFKNSSSKNILLNLLLTLDKS